MSARTFGVNGALLVADLTGVLYWPAEHTLAVADLHLEKGSSLATQGTLLPPYDTRATLERLARAVAHYRPRRVICLGDSFHDPGAADRLDAADLRALAELVGGQDWIWIAGNHDPAPPPGLGGEVAAELAVAPLLFRHQPAAAPACDGEVSGHFHPKARLTVRGRSVQGRCFATDRYRLILPAFGAYTGGLNVLDPAIRSLFGPDLRVYLLGRDRVHRIEPGRLSA